MARWPRIIHGRVVTLRQRLEEAGYFIGQKVEVTKTSAHFEELAASVITDLLHLGVEDYGLGISEDLGAAIAQLSPPDRDSAESTAKFDAASALLFQKIIPKALQDFKEEIFAQSQSRFYSSSS